MLKKYLFVTIAFFSLQANAQVGVSKGHDNSKPVDITADSLEVLQGENKAIFTGDVQAVQGDLDIRSDKMIVYYKKAAAGQKDSKKGAPEGKKDSSESKISKVEVYDNVFISTPKETAKGNKGVYDVDTSIITLTGNVTLTSGKNIVKGSKLVYNLKTGQSKVVSGEADGNVSGTGKKERVHGVFVPNSSKN